MAADANQAARTDLGMAEDYMMMDMSAIETSGLAKQRALQLYADEIGIDALCNLAPASMVGGIRDSLASTPAPLDIAAAYNTMDTSTKKSYRESRLASVIQQRQELDEVLLVHTNRVRAFAQDPASPQEGIEQQLSFEVELFPGGHPRLQAACRSAIHQEAAQQGLVHTTEGGGDQRHVVITRTSE